jgi:hypothetical protein
LKRLRKDVDHFYRVRVEIEFESGRKGEYTHGPYTTARKAREIETRLREVWNRLLSSPANSRRAPDRHCVKIAYDIEKIPVFAWYSVSRNEYVNP